MWSPFQFLSSKSYRDGVNTNSTVITICDVSISFQFYVYCSWAQNRSNLAVIQLILGWQLRSDNRVVCTCVSLMIIVYRLSPVAKTSVGFYSDRHHTMAEKHVGVILLNLNIVYWCYCLTWNMCVYFLLWSGVLV